VLVIYRDGLPVCKQSPIKAICFVCYVLSCVRCIGWKPRFSRLTTGYVVAIGWCNAAFTVDAQDCNVTTHNVGPDVYNALCKWCVRANACLACSLVRLLLTQKQKAVEKPKSM